MSFQSSFAYLTPLTINPDPIAFLKSRIYNFGVLSIDVRGHFIKRVLAADVVTLNFRDAR